MALVDLERKAIVAKVVYFGPAQSGKTTNLRALYDLLPEHQRSSAAEFETPGQATIFFDYFPVHLGRGSGFDITIRLFTVSGQEGRADARRAVLTGADGVVFVADAARGREADNLASMAELLQGLGELHPTAPGSVPVVIQYNKLDLDATADASTLPASLNATGMPEVFASALQQRGVLESLELVAKEVVRNL
ncbi:GTPase domain-containing protein [soil metagenome]